MLTQTSLLLLLCIPTVIIAYDTPYRECKDEESFCQILTKQQCQLRIARQKCRRTCDSCCEAVSAAPESPNCQDSRPGCEESFYLCGVFSEATQQCARTCEVCTPKKPPKEDPVVVCMNKHGPELCNKLGASCAFVTRTPIPRFTTGPDYVLPDTISECMIKENPIAMCYAKYCIQRCNAWMEICKIPSPYGEVTADQVKCLNDQAQLDSCVRKYDARFCYSLVGACASMLGTVYNGGAISKLPGNVLLCIQREDVIAVCRAKHGVAFCTKLSEACATLTKIAMPAFQQGQMVALPDGLAECISKENYIAVLHVQYGMKSIKRWMTRCKVTVWNGPITVVQKECIQEERLKPNPKALCIQKYGAEFCRQLEVACYRVKNVPFQENMLCTVCEIPQIIEECIEKEDFMAMYYAKYGVERLKVWMHSCKITVITGPITVVQKECIEKQRDAPDVMVVCKQKYGMKYCKKLENACFEVMKIPVVVAEGAMLPATIQICIGSDNWMANCYARYGERHCLEWRQLCRNKFSKIDSDLLDEEKECIKSQTVIFECVQKYDAKLCYKMVEVCSQMLDLPYVEGSIQQLPTVVVKCVRTEPTLVLCRARHGLMFCNKLGAACAKLTQSTFPSDLAMVGMDAKIPELVAKCMIEEPYVAIMMVEYGFTKMDSWMSTCKITVWNGPITVVQKECVKKQTLLPDPRTVCVKKYGLDFCNKLIVACFEVKNKKIIGDVPCAACELPNVVNTCLSQEDAIAMCYANHGAASCIVWMKACKIRPMDALTQQQVTCIKKQAEASNVLTVCSKKYGMVFCKKMRLACFEVMRIPMPSDENEAAIAMPTTVSICLTSENWMANCYVRYGSKYCIEWHHMCIKDQLVGSNDFTEEETACMEAQTVIYKCVERFDAKLCYKMVAVCSNMYGIPYAEGPIQKLPPTVLTCLYSGDVMVMCIAKHGEVFCKKLAHSCSVLTKTQLPRFLIGQEYYIPEAVAGCVKQENYLAVMMVEYGLEKVTSWMEECKITIMAGPVTVIQKECIRKQSILPDPREICVQKYGADFCNKLIIYCFEVKNLHFTGATPCAVCQLPVAITKCIAEENYVATCYAKYGPARCNQWMLTCGVIDRYGVITPQQKACIKEQNELPDVITMCRQKYGADFCRKMKMACFELMRVAVPMFANGTTNIVQLPQSVVICISSDNWMARCYVKYGAKQCLQWRETCRAKYTRIDEELTEDERECIKSQSILSKCVMKYDLNYCYKIVEVCSDMHGVPYSEGPVQQLPDRVIKCLYSDDVVVLCRAKNGKAFCDQLAQACSRLSRTRIPRFMQGREFTLPNPIAKCISEENYVAVLYVEFGSAKVIQWLKKCKVVAWNGPISDEQKDCVDKLTFEPDPRQLCVEKYGDDFCNKLISACYEINKISTFAQPTCSICVLPDAVAKCVSEEHFMAMCYAKFGYGRCALWMEVCKIKDPMQQLSQADLQCIQQHNKLPDEVTMCIKKRGEEFCKKLQLACFELMKLPIGVAGKNGEPQLPQPVLFCISSENWMAQCFMRYGEGNCMAWRSVCMEKYSKVAGELSDSEKECIKSQTVIHKCVLKYNAKFCYKIIAVCSDIYKVPYTEGPVQKLPPTVVSCLYSENVVVLCRAKHGVTFCKRLGTACSKLTHVTLPDFTTDVSITMPVVIATCIREENYIATLFVEFGFQKVESWVSRCKITQITSGAITVVQKECLHKLSVEPDPRTVCVQKYGNEFCSLLIEACFKIKNIRLKGSVICPSCVLPEPVFECISKEEFVAMCYARYGIPRCLAYMEECGVAGKEGQMIGAKDWQCIQKLHEMPDPMVTCQKKYGAQFCSAMKLACYEITKVAIVKKPSGSVVILPRVVAACITSESWLARCYAQYGSEQCIEWRQTCRGKGLMIMDGDLTAEEQECMESHTLLFKCVKKYDAKFCYKLLAVCAEMNSVPYTEGPVQQLPQKVLNCLYSEDVVVLCRAKHGLAFCAKLTKACSTLTKTQIPQISVGSAFELPDAIAKCVTEEYYIAVLIVEFGLGKTELWMDQCKITIWNGPITAVQKICVKKQSELPDPKTICVEKYGAEFCHNLITACFDLKRIHMVGIVPCSVCDLPAVVQSCIGKEDFVAMCYAKYGVPRCNEWLQTCGVMNRYGVITEEQKACIKKQNELPSAMTLCTKKYGVTFCQKLRMACFEALQIPLPVNSSSEVLPTSITICIQSENWMAKCYVKYSPRQCNEWREKCRDKYSKLDAELSEFEKECVKSQTIIYQCVQKYDANFCYKIIAVCASMYSVPYTEGPVQRLPQNVVKCLYSNDVVVLCRARHGTAFCNNLAAACSKLTNIPLPQITPDVAYVLPKPVAECMQKEYYIALLFVESGFAKVDKWMKRCKITVWNGPITIVQKECVKKLSSAPDPRAVCLQKYGADFCEHLVVACFQITSAGRGGMPPCSVCALPDEIADCITSENYVAMCYAKYGPARCMSWMIECNVANRPADQLTAADKECIRKQNEQPDAMTVCKKKFGVKFCQRFKVACFDVMKMSTAVVKVERGVEILPKQISICILSNNYMAKCFAKYKKENCMKWLKVCRAKFSKTVIDIDDQRITHSERECIRSQKFIYRCVRKYDANFCYKIIAVCSDINSVPYTEGPVQRLPKKIVFCLNSDDVIVLCRAKHGTEFCTKLVRACSILTKVSVPSVTPGQEFKMPDVLMQCISKEYYMAVLIVEYGLPKIESWMQTCKITVWNGPITVIQKECVKKQTLLPEPRTVCIEKYGADYCVKLIENCYEVARIRMKERATCSVCVLPPEVNQCISEEHFTAVCYTKYGVPLCNAWMRHCNVKNRYGVITQQEQECVKKLNEMPDVVTLCKKKYGEQFCTKLKAACFEVMKIPVPVIADGQVYILPQSISVCIQSENWIARCIVRHGSELCTKWRETCRDKYSKMDTDLTATEKQCIESQMVIYKCVQKFDAKFCYRLIAVCSAIHSIPYTEGPIERIPEKVVRCVNSADVTIMCMAKHGVEFCKKLTAVCAQLTKVTMPEQKPGVDYRIPDPVLKCILEENYIAVMMVEFGTKKITKWMTTCKITVWNGPITVVQKECVQHESVTPEPKVLCMQKYGADFCMKLITACYEIRKVPLLGEKPCEMCELPDVINECISKEEYLPMCYAKFGAAKCNIWLLACQVKDRFGVITADQKECIKKQNDMPDVFLLCKKKYGVEFCTKLKSACFKILKVNVITNVAGNVEVLPHSISICIQSENFMARCYADYGAVKCMEWREKCRDKFSKFDTELTDEEKDCMNSQTVIYKCVQKYDANLCYKMIAVCCRIYSVPYSEGPVQKLPENVIGCLREANPIILCRGKHGVEFCDKLVAGCEMITRLTLPKYMLQKDFQIPDALAKCILEENYVAVLFVEFGDVKVKQWMTTCKITVWNGPITVMQEECVKKLSTTPDPKTVCLQKYGAEFCNKLILACYNIKKMRVTGDGMCAVCVLPDIIGECVANEEFIPMCYAKYGEPRCIAWMIQCRIIDRFSPLNDVQKACMKKQNEMPDAITICKKKYGDEFCVKMRTACFQVMKITITESAVKGAVEILPKSVSICISSDNWMAKCYVKFGQQKCLEWLKICRNRYTRSDFELSDDEKECIKSQSMQVKCIAKYGEQFCSSMLSVCSSMLSIPWKNDSVQRLPPGIVGCAQTTDPVVQCRAKYSESFCNRLGAACSKVTGTDIPAFSRGGGEYRLPEAISQCIAQENIVAMCYASKCSQQCDGWRVTCNINGGMAQLTPEQVTCFEKQSGLTALKTSCRTNPLNAQCRQIREPFETPKCTTAIPYLKITQTVINGQIHVQQLVSGGMTAVQVSKTVQTVIKT